MHSDLNLLHDLRINKPLTWSLYIQAHFRAVLSVSYLEENKTVTDIITNYH